MLQHLIDHQLAAKAGGIQISDNAIAYRGGDVIIVFPNPGERVAPRGLGAHVRATALAQRADAQSQSVTPNTTQNCPAGVFDHWYCFYTDQNFGGRRLQFLTTCSDSANNWGFDNQTTSWVNTNGSIQIGAYDGGNYNGLLWVMGSGVSTSSNVGAVNNDRMSSWRANPCP